MTSPDTFALVRLSNRFNSDFFFRAGYKKVVSHVSPVLKFTISLKITAKNYFQLNYTGKFSVA